MKDPKEGMKGGKVIVGVWLNSILYFTVGHGMVGSLGNVTNI